MDASLTAERKTIVNFVVQLSEYVFQAEMFVTYEIIKAERG